MTTTASTLAPSTTALAYHVVDGALYHRLANGETERVGRVLPVDGFTPDEVADAIHDVSRQLARAEQRRRYTEEAGLLHVLTESPAIRWNKGCAPYGD